MIPDEAVEAAARVMFNQSRMGPLTTWEDVRVEYCGLMRASLEAAAPHIVAQVAEAVANGLQSWGGVAERAYVEGFAEAARDNVPE